MTVSQEIWPEKYRPTTLDEVVGQDAAIKRFKKFLGEDSSGGLPHCLLAGPPGVGKTATVVAFARDFYGDTWQENFREFNASDDRGIDVVREDIKGWCRRAPADGYPYKIVFLDEADQLTKEAQAVLRRTMEQYADTTRFCLSCNWASQLIGPIQSRCATFRFGEIDDDDIRQLVMNVIDAEGIDAEPPAVELVVQTARGRARDAIVTLQTSTFDGELAEEQVELSVGPVDDRVVQSIFEQALGGEFDDARRRLAVEVLKAGVDPDALVESSFRVLNRLDLPGASRAKCFELLATIDERLRMGLNPHVQFAALLGHVYMAQAADPIAQQAGGDDA